MVMEGFFLSEEDDLWVADGYADLGWVDGSEAYIRDVFEQVGVVSDYPVEMAAFIRDWPSRYHLSHQRVNLMESVRSLLDPSWRALELGAGTGAITKWLACAVAEVDALEGSLERARLNRLRTRGDSNVRVLVGDMTTAPIHGDYNLATLIGVLEYTQPRRGQTRREACLRLLQRIRESLRDDGVLLVAIENRLGVKYWAGCSEDHSSHLFDGLIGYPNDTPVTFGRNELESLLREAGFDNQQFYHLHPDYKLPTTVIREVKHLKGFSPHQWMRGLAEDYSGAREHLMPDPLLMKSMEEAGLTWHFANSFLVLCSSSDKVRLTEGWLAKKFSNTSRAELHHTITLVEQADGLWIERRPMRHGLPEVDLGDYRFVISDGPHVEGSLLYMEAYAALVSQDPFGNLLRLCREITEFARAQFAEECAPGSAFPCLSGSAIDCTFWNLIRRNDGSLSFIDTKWTQKTMIPEDFVIFRSLLYCLWEGAPFLRAGLREFLTNLLQELYPAFTDARFVDHLEREQKFQEVAHGPISPNALLDSRRRPILPRTVCDIASKPNAPLLGRRLRTAIRVWREEGVRSVLRLVLVRLGVVRSSSN